MFTCSPTLDVVPVWTPLRKRVLFHLPKKGSIEDQNGVCGSCGKPISAGTRPVLKGLSSSIAAGLFSRTKFCNYFGLWCCKDCHINQKSLIPAAVVQHWNFNLYPFSSSEEFFEFYQVATALTIFAHILSVNLPTSSFKVYAMNLYLISTPLTRHSMIPCRSCAGFM